MHSGNRGQAEEPENMTNKDRKASTYSALSDLSDPPRGGRYKIDKPRSVDDGPTIGTPWNSLWKNDPPEPPLGWSVEEQEPTGEQHEIAASKPKEPTGSPGQVITPGGSSDGSTPAEVGPVVSSTVKDDAFDKIMAEIIKAR
jgi:hypothetical protein